MNEVGAVLLTGAIATIVAIWGVLSQRSIACRRATVDLLARIESDKDHIESLRTFIELSKRPEGLAKWAAEDQEKTTEVQAIRLILNNYELVAIGIQRGVIDYTLYKRWFRSNVVQHWIHAAPFVMALRKRTNNDAFFHEFEQLAISLKEDKMPKRNWWIGRFF